MSEVKEKKYPAKTDAAPAKKDEGKKPVKAKKKKINLKQKFRELVSELKKVTWPTKKDLIRHSLVVMVFVVLVTVVIALYDAGLSALIKLVI